MTNFLCQLHNKCGPLVANFTMRHAIFSSLTKYADRQIFNTMGGPKLPQCPISHLSYKINSAPGGQFHNEACHFFSLDKICLKSNFQHPGWTQTPTMFNFSLELQNKFGPLVANFTMRQAIFSSLTNYAYIQIFITLGGPKLPQCPISHLSY